MYCANCKKEVKQYMNYCPQCGSLLEYSPLEKELGAKIPMEEAMRLKEALFLDESKEEAPVSTYDVQSIMREEHDETLDMEMIDGFDDYEEPDISPKRTRKESIKKKRNRKHTKNAVILGVLGTLSILACISIVLMLLYFFRNTVKQSYVTFDDSRIYHQDGYFYSEKGYVIQVDLLPGCMFQYNDNHSAVAYLTSGNELYMLYNDKQHFIASNVVSFELSYDGSLLAYCVKGDELLASTLYLYNVKNQKESYVAANVKTRDYTVAPDGSGVAYVGEYTEDGGRLYMCLVGKDAVALEKDAIPVALSEKSKALFYVDKSNDLQVYSDNESWKIAENVDNSFVLNQGCNEILFCTEDGIAYYKVSSNRVTELYSGYYRLGRFTTSVPFNFAKRLPVASQHYRNYCYINGKESLEGSIFTANGNIYRINGQGGKATCIAKDMDKLLLSEDWNEILAWKVDLLQKFGQLSGVITKETVLQDKEIRDVVLTGAQQMYVLMKDGQLMNAQKTLKPVDTNVWKMKYFAGEDKLVYQKDNQLYYMGENQSMQLIANDVVDFGRMGEQVWYTQLVDGAYCYRLYDFHQANELMTLSYLVDLEYDFY